MAEELSAGHCMVYKPTFGDRAARFFGYRFDMGVEPPNHEALTEGWARTTTRLHFSLAGRLRLLFSGKLKIDQTHYANTRIDQMETRTDLTLYAPWEKDSG